LVITAECEAATLNSLMLRAHGLTPGLTRAARFEDLIAYDR